MRSRCQAHALLHRRNALARSLDACIFWLRLTWGRLQPTIDDKSKWNDSSQLFDFLHDLFAQGDDRCNACHFQIDGCHVFRLRKNALPKVDIDVKQHFLVDQVPLIVQFGKVCMKLRNVPVDYSLSNNNIEK